jgi:hypothetical protein
MNRQCRVGDIIRSKAAANYQDSSVIMLGDNTGGCHDTSFGNTRWLVVKTEMDGGSDGHDPYPDGYRVNVLRMDDQGFVVTSDRPTFFYQSGSFTCMIEPKDIELVGHAANGLVPVQVVKRSTDTQISVLDILDEIKRCLDQVEQWAGMNEYRHAHEYSVRGKTLVELLEIERCGNTGGYDDGQKDRTLAGRYRWLRDHTPPVGKIQIQVEEE